MQMFYNLIFVSRPILKNSANSYCNIQLVLDNNNSSFKVTKVTCVELNRKVTNATTYACKDANALHWCIMLQHVILQKTRIIRMIGA